MKEQDLHNSIVDYLNYYPHILWTSTLGGVYLGKGNYKQKALKVIQLLSGYDIY